MTSTLPSVKNRKIWLDSDDGELFLDEEAAIAMLLDDGVVHCGHCRIATHDGKIEEDYSIVMYVLCNDLFAWACADGENIGSSDLPLLVKLHQDTKNNWGSQIWCCLKRKMQPQSPVKKHMIEDGVWTPELEALPPNHYDAAIKKAYADKQSKQNNPSTK